MLAVILEKRCRAACSVRHMRQAIPREKEIGYEMCDRPENFLSSEKKVRVGNLAKKPFPAISKTYIDDLPASTASSHRGDNTEKENDSKNTG